MEAACDEAAVRGQSSAACSAYCESILRFAMRGAACPAAWPLVRAALRPASCICCITAAWGPGPWWSAPWSSLPSMTACMVRPTLENAPAATPETAEAAEPEATPTPHRRRHLPLWSTPPSCRCWRTPTTAPLFIDPVPDYKYISRFKNNSHRGDDLCAAPGTMCCRGRWRCRPGRRALQLGQLCGHRPRHERARATAGAPCTPTCRAMLWKSDSMLPRGRSSAT